MLFSSDEFVVNWLFGNMFMGCIGNVELVCGIFNLFNLVCEIDGQDVLVQCYQCLVVDMWCLFDVYYWLGDVVCDGVEVLLWQISVIGELVLDEYEKVQLICQ